MKTKKEITEQIETEYKNKRRKARIIALENKNKLYDEHKILENIDRQIDECYLKIMKMAIDQEYKNKKTIEDTISLLNKKRIEYITKNKIDISLMDIRYECSLCKDTGIIYKENNSSKCQCYINRYNFIAYENTNMLSLTKKCNFSTFNINMFDDEKKYGIYTQREFMEKMRDKSIFFVNNFDDVNEKSMIFYGNTGLGKSFLCLCIADELIKRKKSVLYESSIDLFEKLSDHIFRREQAENSVFYSLVINSDLLIIDDLGTELVNSFIKNQLFNIVNTRTIKGLKTIISTNLTQDELKENYDQRTFSRFSNNYNSYKFIGKDLRIYN